MKVNEMPMPHRVTSWTSGWEHTDRGLETVSVSEARWWQSGGERGLSLMWFLKILDETATMSVNPNSL